MTRKKLKLAFLSDDKARKAIYKKRMKSIIKKVSELAILCNIPACAIISNPFNSKTEKITKAREKLENKRQATREKELTIRMIEYMKNKTLPNDLSVLDLKEFDKLSKKHLKDIDNKIVELNGSN
ncbi:hypothetical protein P8452_13276 [Trifolium repens]|nr:hypothetical protein P8452_13276 [Trifolium repens]